LVTIAPLLDSLGDSLSSRLSIVGTLILLVVVDRVIGLRVSPDQEATSLDLSQHNEEGYDLNN
jgi:Amt family ammonium transporter